jgi:hypothetical protein
MIEVRADVLPVGAPRDDNAPSTQPHVRRFSASDKQLESGRVEFLFDGRDGTGDLLPAGAYRVTVFVRSDGGESCDDPPSNKSGLLTTVQWSP